MMITKGWNLARTVPGSLTTYSFIGILGTPEVAAVLYSVTKIQDRGWRFSLFNKIYSYLYIS